MSNNKLIETKKRAKAKKPVFLRQDEYRFTRLKTKWRKPRGIHSKLRRRRAGKRAVVMTGYKTPCALQGCNAKGLKLVIVATVKEIETLDKTKQSAIIARTVGKKKRVELLTAAEKNGIEVYNIKDTTAHKKSIADDIATRKKKRAERSQSKKKKEEKKETKIEKKEEEKETEKKEEKIEKDKERRKAEKVMIQK